MSSSYENYALLRTIEDPEQECIDWFWVGLNDDDVYPKEFLESLMQMMDRVDRGEEKLIPLDEDFFDRLKNLVEDVELGEDEIG
jgi:hypothetical protein